MITNNFFWNDLQIKPCISLKVFVVGFKGSYRKKDYILDVVLES